MTFEPVLLAETKQITEMRTNQPDGVRRAFGQPKNSPASLALWRGFKTTICPQLVALAFTCVLTSCTTMKVTSDRSRATDQYQNRQEHGGLRIALEPVTDKEEVQKWFKTDLVGKGVLPVLVVAENTSSDKSYLLSREHVFLQDGDPSTGKTSELKQVTSDSAGMAVTTVGVAAISLPLVVVGLKMASDASVIQHNLAEKELYAHTLQPGQSTHGFVYFPFPKGVPITGMHRFLVEAVGVPGDNLTPFEFDLR